MLRRSLVGIALSVAVVLTSLLPASAQNPLPPPTVGEFTSVSVGAAPEGAVAVTAPSAPAAGALIYTDYVAIEQEARQLLADNLAFRESISPYNSKPNFITLIQKFDYAAGFNKELEPGVTLQARIDKADTELRRARDLYAFLAVYATAQRFRNDDGSDPGNPLHVNYKGVFCAKAENPNPPDPANGGQVLPPVIDWCDFTARLRQSVRESANIRMVFGQQFVADALGLHFSGTAFKGGDYWVKDEVAKLRAAENQYELVQKGLAEALDRPLGSGCVVSDFFTQAEWSLLSEAAESKETAQHHIAVRQSYLGITTVSDVPIARANAKNTYRAAATDGHIKLIGLAGVGAGQPTGVGCARGQRPDGLLVAEMAANMLKTREEARHLAENRNVFGFDVTFTPARPYLTSPNSGDRGLWQEANDLADFAKQLQNDEVANTRAFDTSQEKLIAAVEGIRGGINKEISAASGCTLPGAGAGEDEKFFACAEQQTKELDACLDLIKSEVLPVGGSAFDTCLDRPVIKKSDAERGLRDLRGVWLQEKGILIKIDNLNKRVQLADDRNATVKIWMGLAGGAQTAAEVAQVVADGIEVTTGVAAGTTVKPGNVVAGVLTGLAGAMSTSADIKMEDAANHQETENLLLDMVEARADLAVAEQQYKAMYSVYDGFRGDENLIEARRQRAYLQHSPANDPSFRIVRDSSRLQLAKALERAARVSYLSARRAEYEYAARLSASNFRISDIYRARTAEDIQEFLKNLRSKTDSLAGAVSDAQVNPADFQISVAQYVLGLSDAALAREGFTGAAAQAERTRRFRIWVAQNTFPNNFEPPFDGKPVLRFKLATNIQDGGVFADNFGSGYSRLWLQKMAAVGKPKPTNTGLSVDLRTDQQGLAYRNIAVTQAGLVQLRAQSGCIFDYRLMAPAVLLGLEWAGNQNPEAATAIFNANVNSESNPAANGFRASEFLGRAISGTEWEVLVFADGPASLPDMDLQKLTDIVLNFSTTYASRQPGTPVLSECVRIDF